MNKVGKRVGGALYVHLSATDLLDTASQERIVAAEACAPLASWNVVKLTRSSVSLLCYEDFQDVAFPALRRAWTIRSSEHVTLTDYSSRQNPPILHRKELLLRPDDPRLPAFRALTLSAEERGLFAQSSKIGTRRAWLERLSSAGLTVERHKLVPIGSAIPEVARHRTAIVRRDLSQPITQMLRWGIIEPDYSIFDYGCGQGDDVSALKANGFEAFGWDPHHAPDGRRTAADIVNLGFVLNVIEDPVERRETLRAAWSFAERALTVSVMVPGKQPVTGLRPYKDGFLTSRGTFQAYFATDQLRELVESSIGHRSIALAPGIVTVFRDPDLEQEVAYRRRSRARVLIDGFEIPERPRVEWRASPTTREKIQESLGAVWATALGLGRAPEPGELPPEVLTALATAKVNARRAISLAIEDSAFDREQLVLASAARREDLVVYFALSLFPGAPRYTTLAKSIQRDVKTFFRSHAEALEVAQRLLFSAGRGEVVTSAGDEAVSKGLAAQVPDTSTLRFMTSALDRLPAVLRVRAGCAELLRDDLLDADFLEVDLSAPIVRGVFCDDVSRHFPVRRKTVEIDLQALRSRRLKGGSDVMYLKGRYMPHDDPDREKQLAIDDQLVDRGLVDNAGAGPSLDELRTLLVGQAS